jgi:hypothetical protein
MPVIAFASLKIRASLYCDTYEQNDRTSSYLDRERVSARYLKNLLDLAVPDAVDAAMQA